MNNMNLFEKYDSLNREWCQVSSQISEMVSKWEKENVGFVTDETPYNGYKGLTRPGECGWSIIDHNKISISYAVYEDRYGDYWSDDKYAEVEYDELIKYMDK